MHAITTTGLTKHTITTLLTGAIAGATFAGVIAELPVRNVPLLWLNATLLFGSFAAVSLAASASFDRFASALGVSLGFVVLMYFLEILGSLWPAAAKLQPYSLFHYLNAKAILLGSAALRDDAFLATVIIGSLAWGLAVFPRRDLAAPS